MQNKLIDKNELSRKFPALTSRPSRISWLIRTRQIPFVKIGRRIYFLEDEIARWIKSNSYKETNY